MAYVINEDSAFSVMHRVHNAGEAITQADISSITYAIYPVDSTTAHTASTSLVVANVVFDSLQTDGRWTEDTTGYNFRHDGEYTIFTEPGTYEIEYTFTPTNGQQFKIVTDPIVVNAVKSS